MKRTRLLQDKSTGLLWLDEMSYRQSGIIEITKDQKLDLATCNVVVAEAVCAMGYHFCMASADFYVYKNKQDMMTVMVPYHDTWGFGATYASILPGFSFKSVFGYAKNWELYFIAENAEGKWGVIRISHNSSLWPACANAFCIPIEFVRFECDSFMQASARSGLNFTPDELYACGNCYFGDLSRVPEDKNHFSGTCGIDGDTIQDILHRRGCGEGKVKI